MKYRYEFVMVAVLVAAIGWVVATIVNHIAEYPANLRVTDTANKGEKVL
jgi:hypothetical protein